MFNRNDFGRFKEMVVKRREQKTLEGVNITQFVEGVAASITGCVTKHGVLTMGVQTQVVDVPELGLDKNRSGVFRGHDWSFVDYSQKVQSQAEKIAVRLGECMAKDGYKGIFGVDLVVDIDRDRVYPIECNPRYTGAFPVYTMMQMERGEIPLDVFQLMEFLRIDYKCDVELVNRSWKRRKQGAHLVLNNRDREHWMRVVRAPGAGVFKLSGGKLEKAREGLMYQDIKGKDEFVLTDGVPFEGQVVKPGLRLGKLIFRRGILSKANELNDFGRMVVEGVVNSYELEQKEEQ